jgi:hypothetical protein
MSDTNLIYPYEFEGGKKAIASEVMANFEAVQLVVAGLNAEINSLTTALTDLKKKPTREMLDIFYSFSKEAPTGAFPLWTGETLNNAKTLYPQFWKKINQLAEDNAIPTVSSLTEYDEKVEQYGQCASFYINTLDGYIRLPKITRFISSIKDLAEIGEYNDKIASHNHGDLQTVRSAVGKKDGVRESYWVGSKEFDVHGRVNEAYDWGDDDYSAGEGDETMPKHVRLYLYLQVVNNTAEISELDVSVIADQLNNALAELESVRKSCVAEIEALKDEALNEVSEKLDDLSGDFYTKDEIDGKIGDIDTVLDGINGEVI